MRISYRVVYSRQAQKFIRKHSREGLLFMKAFSDLTDHIKRRQNYDIIHYKHSKYNDVFRLRLGKYRAIFRIIDQEIIIFVIDIGSRGDIYKSIL